MASTLTFPKHIVSIRDLSIDFVEFLLVSANKMKEIVENCGGDEILKHKVQYLRNEIF